MLDYEIKIAQISKEIEAAQKLRFEIFNLEKKEGIANSKEGIDADRFDKYCDHLIVIDKSKDLVVGTYRLLLDSHLKNGIGFHSEEIFELNGIKGSKRRLLELGRSCVHKDYRNSTVIALLWNGIATYIKENYVKYIFGCARLNTIEPLKVSEAYVLLREKYLNNDFKVNPKPENVFIGLNPNVTIQNVRKIFRELSPLIKGYLNLGAQICSEPAVNLEFSSVVFFMLLDMDRIKNSYKRHFLNIYPS